MSRMPLNIPGKTKVVFPLQKGLALLRFKDDITALNGRKHKTLHGKGAVSAQISAILFDELHRGGVPNHFHCLDTNNDMLCDFVHAIPLEVVVRLKARGSIVSRLGIAKDAVFGQPVVELYYKAENTTGLHDPLVNSSHVRQLGLATNDELNYMLRMSMRASLLLQKLFASIHISLIDMKLEFGRAAGSGQLLLSDQLSPDNLRLRDSDQEECSLDKDVFRHDSGDVLSAYQTVLERLRLTVC